MRLKSTTKLPEDNLVNLSESLINSLVERDPISNEILEGFLSDFASNFKANIEKADILLRDDTISLFLYAEKSLKNIIKEPKYKKIKVDKFIDKSRLKKTTPKTINWIGRQPGRNIREKMINVDKVLSQVIVDTYDVKENQVTVYVLKILCKAFREKEEYLKGLNIKEKSEFLSDFRKIMLEKEKSNINEVKDIYHVIPNNTLIGHKNYSIVWKTMKKITKLDSERKIKEYSLNSRLIKVVFFALVSKFATFENLTNIEEYIYLKEGLTNKELEAIDKERNLKKQGDISFEFLGRGATKFPKIQFIINKESKSPKKVTVIQLIKQIRIEIEDIKAVGAVGSKKEDGNSKFICSIKFDLYKFIKSRKENSLFVDVDFNKKQELSFVIEDTKTIKDFINKIISNIESINNIKFKEEKLEVIKAKDYGELSLDFTGNEPFVNLNGEKVVSEISNNIVKYDTIKSLEKNFKTEKNSIYINHKGITYVKDIFDNYENNDNKTALSMYFDNIKKVVEPKAKSILLYNMPDSIEEIYQKPIKEIVNSRFNKNTFPVWRSVAAVTKGIKDNSIKFKENRIILVMDFNTSHISTGVILMKKEKTVKEGFIIKHFQPFKEEKAGLEINEKSIMKKYLNLYLDEQNLLKDKGERKEFIENIIKKSIINKVFIDKKNINEFILNQSGIESFISIKYDHKIMEKVLEDFKEKFKKFIEKQKDSIKSFENNGKDKNMKITYGVVLCNTLNNIIEDSVKKILKGVLEKEIETKVYSALEILEGSDFYHKRIENKQKTWIEHLPKLSLEVPRNYQYNILTLVGKEDQQGMDVMGQNNIIEVEETLIIPKGKKEIKFPIIKEDISSNSRPIEIVVKHKSFPLERDEEVKIIIEYIYGKEDSYNISLYPKNEKNPQFQKIKVNLKSEEKEIEGKIVIPKIEKIVTFEKVKEYISRDINSNDNDIKLEKDIKRNIFEFKKIKYYGDNYQEKKYKALVAFIERAINRKSKVYVELSLSNENIAKEYLKNISKGNLFKYIKELTRMEQGIHVEKSFFRYIESDDEFKNFYKRSMYYLFSAGGLTPKKISNEFLNNYESLYKNIYSMKSQKYWDRIKRLGLLQLLVNNKERKPFEVLVKDILTNKIDEVLINDLLRVCKVDAKIIMSIFSLNGEYDGEKVIKKIIHYIEKDFKKHYEKLNEISKKYKIKQNDSDKIISNLEMLYIILTLRENPNFKHLKSNSEGSKLLARNIRAIDRHLERKGIWKKTGEEKICDSTMDFTGINKPDSLKNVRDIVYAVNLYLTGDDGANNIIMNAKEIED